ncbi:MAG: nucleoside triphosphate pyrophosphohydrolase [SAR202 cluster bacterium]|nr:nucleoside triphosphate pyrophosphohydrolase [SAR202 cluster bacterium]
MTTRHDERETFEGLRSILARLRAPDGCPWDREQTHQSLRKTLLEECYEALDALDRDDAPALSEELGDVLLQIAFHCQIAEERGEFTYAQVFQRLNDKLVRRHPHVFGDASASTAKDVEEQWEALKEQERAGRESLLDGVSASMPALAFAQTVSQRAVRAGFEWEVFQDVKAKVMEEINEVEEAASQEEREEEMGDVLFTLVNVARWMGVDAESALRGATQRFGRRFRHMERAAQATGVAFTQVPLAEKEALWEAAKRELKGEEGGGAAQG